MLTGMISSFLITFREVLEVAIITGIIFSWINKTKQFSLKKSVYAGLTAGVLLSLVVAYLFQVFAGGFEGKAEEIFEGSTMLIGAILISFLIGWVVKQKTRTASWIEGTAEKLVAAKPYGLFVLVMVSVLREGVEMVIFLTASKFSSPDNNSLAILLGIVAAILFGYAIYFGAMKISLNKFFAAMSFLLILFAGGLVVHGIGEFTEAGLISPIVDHIWDIGSFLPEEGTLGSFLNGMFGYVASPSIVQMVAYVLYLVVAFWWFLRGGKRT